MNDLFTITQPVMKIDYVIIAKLPVSTPDKRGSFCFSFEYNQKNQIATHWE